VKLPEKLKFFENFLEKIEFLSVKLPEKIEIFLNVATYTLILPLESTLVLYLSSYYIATNLTLKL